MTIWLGSEAPHCEEPTGPRCPRCRLSSVVSAAPLLSLGLPELYACPTHGEFFEGDNGMQFLEEAG